MQNHLGKRKYIYRVYSSEDRIIHCERYHVIYINSKVVYYKGARKQEYLNYKLIGSVDDEFIGVNMNRSGYYEKYFWKVENFDSKKETELAYSLQKKTDIENAKESMNRAEKEYAIKKQKYYELLGK